MFGLRNEMTCAEAEHEIGSEIFYSICTLKLALKGIKTQMK